MNQLKVNYFVVSKTLFLALFKLFEFQSIDIGCESISLPPLEVGKGVRGNIPADVSLNWARFI